MRELAALAKVAYATISRVENGQKAELRTARKLAAALKVEPHELMAPEQDQGQHKAA